MEAEVEVDLKGVRTSTQKIVEKHRGTTTEMYALSDDPKEQHDVSRTDRAKEFDNLNKQFQDWKKRMQPYAGKGRTTKESDLAPRLLRQLKSLGYIH